MLGFPNEILFYRRNAPLRKEDEFKSSDLPVKKDQRLKSLKRMMKLSRCGIDLTRISHASFMMMKRYRPLFCVSSEDDDDELSDCDISHQPSERNGQEPEIIVMEDSQSVIFIEIMIFFLSE